MIKQEFRNLKGYKLYRHTSPSGKMYIKQVALYGNMRRM